MTQHHPTPQGLNGLIDNLVNTIHYTWDTAIEPEFDLSLDGVIVQPSRTAAALAGWYALAGWDRDTLLTDSRGYVAFSNPQGAEDDTRCEPILDVHCADAFAQALGFNDRFALQDWASANPAFWGNPYGENMFHLSIAYGTEEQPTLDAVLNHWQAVARRLEKLTP